MPVLNYQKIGGQHIYSSEGITVTMGEVPSTEPVKIEITPEQETALVENKDKFEVKQGELKEKKIIDAKENKT